MSGLALKSNETFDCSVCFVFLFLTHGVGETCGRRKGESEGVRSLSIIIPCRSVSLYATVHKGSPGRQAGRQAKQESKRDLFEEDI